VSAIEHRIGFLFQCRFGPVMDTTGMGNRDLAMLVFTGNPV
jgi:hypothetical protein